MAKGQNFRLLNLLNRKLGFFKLSTFTPGSFHAPRGKSLYSTSFESAHGWLKIFGWAEVWQYSKLLECLIENQHFAS